MKRIVLGLLAATVMVLPAFAADVQPAILYDLGGKFDKSFNEAAYHGAEKFKTETGVAYVEFEVSNASQREQALRRFAEDGHNPIVDGRLRLGGCAEEGRGRISRPQLRHHRRCRRSAQCPLAGIQGE